MHRKPMVTGDINTPAQMMSSKTAVKIIFYSHVDLAVVVYII